MVKHIVLFKLDENLSVDARESVMNRFKEAIESLPATIPTIRKIFVGLNVNPDEHWDICLESELADVKAYAVHPAHVAAAGILKGAKQDRACCDYEY